MHYINSNNDNRHAVYYIPATSSFDNWRVKQA